MTPSNFKIHFALEDIGRSVYQTWHADDEERQGSPNDVTAQSELTQGIILIGIKDHNI